MNKFVKFAFAHRRLLVALAFVALAALFLNGVVRSYDYSVPMLTGDYEQAATYKSPYSGPPKSSDAPPMPPGMDDDSWESWILEWIVQRYQGYVDAAVGSRELAAFNHGWTLYQSEKYDEARYALERAYASSCDSSGRILPRNRQLGSDIQLLIGNCHVNAQKTEEAAAAYELSLTLDPDNIVSTYNLERLQDSSKGGGSGTDKKGDKPQPAGPPKPRAKI
jgi:tetratricopeptide (TPR) repeat protein